jgi:Carboxypeptidase regulatory-like domain
MAPGHLAAAQAGFGATSRAQIDIVIHNALGRLVRGARVDIQGGDGRVVATAASDDDGRISAKQIAVGTYVVVVRRGGFQDATSVVTALCPPCRREHRASRRPASVAFHPRGDDVIA